MCQIFLINCPRYLLTMNHDFDLLDIQIVGFSLVLKSKFIFPLFNTFWTLYCSCCARQTEDSVEQMEHHQFNEANIADYLKYPLQHSLIFDCRCFISTRALDAHKCIFLKKKTDSLLYSALNGRSQSDSIFISELIELDLLQNRPSNPMIQNINSNHTPI